VGKSKPQFETVLSQIVLLITLTHGRIRGVPFTAQLLPNALGVWVPLFPLPG
jgi:hypothetical protein